MSDRPRHARPGPSGTGVGGVVRIVGSYPPPPPPPPPPPRTGVSEAAVAALLARPPTLTRYQQGGARAPRTVRPSAGRAWAAASAVLAAAGIAAVLLPQHTGPSARLAVPQAVDSALVAAAPTTPPALGGATTPAAEARQLPASDPVRVQIPALGVTSQIMHLGLERDGSMEVPPGAYPVGWYQGSSTPGQLGAAVLAGHVDWKGEPGAFYGLRDLRDGDSIVIDRADGSTATFTVDRVAEHPKDAFPTQEVYGDLDHPGLRLITCGGAFDADTGDYQANIIVFASLTTTG